MGVTDHMKIAWQPLHEFTRQVFLKAGMSSRDAELGADVLIWANLCGIDSHGVIRIKRYTDNIQKGLINTKPEIKIIKETPAILFIEADQAFGPAVTSLAIDKVVEKAHTVGIGWAFIANNTHQGAIGYYARKIAEKGMAGILFVSQVPNMAPFGAKVPGVANNPLTISVPTKTHGNICLDMATSVAAAGKILLAMEKGVPIPQGWAIDKSGEPTTDPNKAATNLPIAGAKGSGLALMIECLSSIIINNPLLEPNLLNKTDKPAPIQNSPPQNCVVAAINIGMFTDIETYKQHMDMLVDALKALPRANGFNEIMMPGEPENKIFNERSQNGIPISSGTMSSLKNISEQFSVSLPAIK